MRYAVVTDVHGDAARLRDVMEQVGREGVDHVISLGDLFECKIGKSSVDAFRYRAATEVFDADPELAELVDGAFVLRGNQEERIVSLVPDSDLPRWTHRLLDAPLERRTGFATYCHGHHLPWKEVEPGMWSPAEASFSGRVLVHGHHHRSAVHRLGPDLSGPRTTVPRFGEPFELEAGARYVVNVGSVTEPAPGRGPSPAWAVVDEAAATVTYHCPGRT
ncbi:metallophosphoesterase family protein [Glycomyces tenuis]|uniref:metallophosphoesterase family protein n=1 Tax=Glycomyces tenuis TaxID=58116 RepID=UPI0006883660|nr:metallophosphoesterase family protein [Glycomyces tenuis]